MDTDQSSPGKLGLIKILTVSYSNCIPEGIIEYVDFEKKIRRQHQTMQNYPDIGVAPITPLRTCVIKIVTFKGDHLMS